MTIPQSHYCIKEGCLQMAKFAGLCSMHAEIVQELNENNVFIANQTSPYSGPVGVGIGIIDNAKAVISTTKEYTGGSVNYYSVEIKNPTTGGRDQYTAECNDIIEALNMNYAEGNAFKAIWRKCAARLGKSKEGYKDGLYDAEKVEFFGKRMVEQEKQSQK